MTFEAYGRRFNFQLQPNESVARAVPTDRSDIEALRGQVEGQPGSWVRMTRTRTGWHGVVSDGVDLYAIEPAADVAGEVVQPLAVTSASSPVMYRLKDALLPSSQVFCEILNPDGTPYTGTEVSAQMLYQSVVKDIVTPVAGPSLELIVGVVADYEFYQATSDDPEGAIIARMDMVDGIWSSQVGVKISLAPLTVIRTAAEPFTKSAPSDLLAQVKQYRSSHADQMQTGVTHLMTGRDLDGDIVGIAYMGTVCNSQTGDSVSEGAHTTLMSALIAAHELGHNFNAPHDGEAGACSTTPQTYLMAPKINFSSEFSSCSLTQIKARIKTAQCLIPYQAPDVVAEAPATAIGAVENTLFTVSFVAHAIGDDPSTDVTTMATLPANLTLQSATAPGGTCTIDGVTASCSLGTLNPQETREITLSVVGTVGKGTATFTVASPNDYVSGDDSVQAAIEVSAAATPPASPVTSTATSSGGGGGGSLDFEVLSVLAGVAGWAAARRRLT